MPSVLILGLLLVFGLLILAGVALYRLVTILDPRRPKPYRSGRVDPSKPTHLLIVLGSGGHTAEMIAMLERATGEPDSSLRLDWRDYGRRTWVVGSGDGISSTRAKEFEEHAVKKLQQGSQEDGFANGEVTKRSESVPGTYDIAAVPRARAIHQPLLTTPFSALRCMFACLRLLTAHTDPRAVDFPDVILCNGPATATILIFASIILRFFDIHGCSSRGKLRTIYIESWARVSRLSLSGRLLCHVVDRFLVQWPQLVDKSQNINGRAEFVGVLV